MKAFWFIFVFSLILAGSAVTAQAQDDFVLGEVLDQPQCFNVVNTAPYTVYGSINTNEYKTPDDITARHRSNFRLKTQEQVEFCTSGPFYEGQKVDLTLRTLVPIFSCMTRITGDIVIKGVRKDEGGTETWAECL